MVALRRAGLSVLLLLPAVAQEAGQNNDGWVMSMANLCDGNITMPYFIGHLHIAAAACAPECPTSTYPDNRQLCHPCPVVGCETCSGNSGCKDCLIFHFLTSEGSDGQCLFLFGGVFGAIVPFAFCVLLCGMLRLCCLGLTSPTSPGVLKEALAHRRRAKVHDYHLPGNPFFAYDDTNMRKHNVSGVGPMLYFKYTGFLAMLGFLLVFLLLIGYFLPQLDRGDEMLIPMPEVPKEDMKLAIKIHAIVTYLLAFLVITRWMFTQDSTVKINVEEELHLRNYCLVAEGFPKSARSAHEIKAFFESILGFELEGISIAYDHVEEMDFIGDRISKAVEKADTQLGVYPAELSGLEGAAGDSQDGYVLDCLMNSGFAFVVFSREEDREFCMRRFQEIDRQVRQGLHIEKSGEDDSEDEERQALLEVGPAKGKGPRPGAPGGAGAPSRAVLFRGKFPVRVGHAPEPCGIQWRNFTVRRGLKVARVLGALSASVLMVLMVGAVMFAPAVLYEMSYVDIRKPSRNQERFAIMESGIVACSTAVGSRLINAGLKRAAAASGFLQKVNEDSVFCACTYFTLTLSSVAPLVIASMVSSTQSIMVPRMLAVEWLFQVFWMTLLATELSGIFYPMWRYWSAYFFTRNSRYITVREAEPLLTSPEFPLATRYVDLLHSFTLVCVMIAVKGQSLYTIGAQCLMLLYSIYVYFLDKYMFLRVNKHTYYTSPKLDSTVHYLFAVPVSILFLFPLQYCWVSTLWMNFALFAGNSIFFLVTARICQKCNEPHRELSDIPYVEVASLVPYNFFNTNPVHVLRTIHFPSIVVPPIYPWRSGKEYLQGGQFADYDDSVRLRETLMLLVKNKLKGLENYGNPQDN